MSDTMFVSFSKPFITYDLGYLKPKENEIILLFKNQISYAKQLNDLIEDTFFISEEFDEVCKRFPFLLEDKTKELIKLLVTKINEIPS